MFKVFSIVCHSLAVGQAVRQDSSPAFPGLRAQRGHAVVHSLGVLTLRGRVCAAKIADG